MYQNESIALWRYDPNNWIKVKILGKYHNEERYQCKVLEGPISGRIIGRIIGIDPPDLKHS